MLKNQNIICISSVDWDFIWQGHQEIMSTFARNDNRVLFIENTGVRTPNFKDVQRIIKRVITWSKSIKGFRKETENLYVYSPLILPFPYSRIARLINKYLLIGSLKKWMKAVEFYNPIVWTFLPTGTALEIINNIEKKLLIYYCIADFYALVDNVNKVRGTEDVIMKRSDLIFVQGKVLEDKCKRLNNNVHIFPFGVNIQAFEDSQNSTAKLPEDLSNTKRPFIGYMGGIHKHIDFGLIKFIANTHPEWSIVLIGPTQTDICGISGLQNVFLLGQKDFSKVPYYIKEFSVCIIPYLKTEYTDTVYPTKLNEYHALGKTVVSTDLPEVAQFNAENDNLVLVAKTYEEFANCISKTLNNTNEILINKRISSARKNSWVNRIEEMSDLIEDTIDKKSKMAFDWRKNFLELYWVARRKVLKLGFILSSVYLLIFYTPLVWFLASPLNISQLPRKADCIVVFAGGVGESGQAGQGYEERVQYAVQLYKGGYASQIIFSSGYMYVFKEPLVMKALAISLGVTEEAIILNDKPKNTYENVKTSKEILDKNNWNDILLVTSPYHTLRASLVFNKVAPDLKVISAPIPDSTFYRHGVSSRQRKVYKQVTLKQIKGILHEYLGIIYYWWKGYI